MSNIHVLFPTLVHETTLNEDNVKLETIIANKYTITESNNWRCDTKSTIDTCNIIQDTNFSSLINAITKEVAEFSETFGAYGPVKIVDAWVNVSSPGSFQEYHNHPNSHFSVAYYIKTPDMCGDIILRSHEADTDMFSLPLTEFKPASYKTWAFCPEVGKLIIFRSNTKHMVEKNRSNEDRISFSANFVIESHSISDN